jgi:hypothetical protein
MRTVTERLVFGMAAAAKCNGGSAGKAERFALRVDDFEVALYADIAIVIDDDFCGGHSFSGRQQMRAVQNHS